MHSSTSSILFQALLTQDMRRLDGLVAKDPAILLQRVPWDLDGGVAMTPIASACASLGLDRSLSWLIGKHQQAGLPLNAVDQHLNTPAVLACKAGHAAALEVWLAFEPKSVDSQDEDGDDLLDIVVTRSHIGCLEVLVNTGADPTAWEDGASASLLHLASEMSSPEMILHLVQRCGLPVDGLNGKEQTPLENVVESTIVVDEDKAPRVQALLDAGARCTFPLSRDLKRSLRKHPMTQAVFDKLQAKRQAEHLDGALPDPSPSAARPRF